MSGLYGLAAPTRVGKHDAPVGISGAGLDGRLGGALPGVGGGTIGGAGLEGRLGGALPGVGGRTFGGAGGEGFTHHRQEEGYTTHREQGGGEGFTPHREQEEEEGLVEGEEEEEEEEEEGEGEEGVDDILAQYYGTRQRAGRGSLEEGIPSFRGEESGSRVSGRSGGVGGNGSRVGGRSGGGGGGEGMYPTNWTGYRSGLGEDRRGTALRREEGEEEEQQEDDVYVQVKFLWVSESLCMGGRYYF